MTDPTEPNGSAESPWLQSEKVGERVRVHVPLNVPPWVLMYGGKQSLAMEVEGEAKIIAVTVPPGSKPGQTLRLRKVMFGAQQVDLYVELEGLAINPQIVLGVLGALVAGVVALISVLLNAG